MIPAFPLLAAAAPSTTPRYFPDAHHRQTVHCAGLPGGRPQAIVSRFEDQWYSSELAAAGEPSLAEAQPRLARSGGTVQRFTWLRSFHHTIVVRIEWSPKSLPRLIAKELSGAGGYAPGKVRRTVDRRLTAAEARRVRAVIQQTQVLRIPPTLCDIGCDGAQWLIEGADRAGYRLVARWSPESGPVRDFGLALLKLTGWQVGEVY